jgi:hypothetical protein
MIEPGLASDKVNTKITPIATKVPIYYFSIWFIVVHTLHFLLFSNTNPNLGVCQVSFLHLEQY